MIFTPITRISTAALTLTFGLLMAGHAHAALNFGTKRGACPNGFWFPSNQHLSVNTTHAPAVKLSAMQDAVEDVARRINEVGGSWFEYTSFGTTSGGYTNNGPDGIYQNGVNEVGYTPDIGAGMSGMSWVDTTTCETIEADVFVSNHVNWIWDLPSDVGIDYYDALPDIPIGQNFIAKWGRNVLLHELGHTHSFAHSDLEYSFMNYGVMPFANAPHHAQVEPLPADREAFRTHYSDGSTEKDIGATVTWFTPVVTGNGSAKTRLLCRPSGGDDFSPGLFDSTCGVTAAGDDGPTELCPGDALFTRFALPNYGTEDLDVDMELWFSSNDFLSTTAGLDVQSPTRPGTITVNGGNSARRGIEFMVPLSLSHDSWYYPIIFLNTGADLGSEESDQNNWIPLRRQIYIKPASDC